MVSLKYTNLTIKIILRKNILSREYFTHINVIINIQVIYKYRTENKFHYRYNDKIIES